VFASSLELQSQGYIVPNGVIQVSNSAPSRIDIVYDPVNLYYTGFFLRPKFTLPPGPYLNIFEYGRLTNVGVRVFLVSSNEPISLQPILSQSYTELVDGVYYLFDSGAPFYVGLYTGNQLGPPTNGIYADPLFGWAQLVNNQGMMQLLDGAMVYRADGIYAGTRNIISDVPEPSVPSVVALGALLLGWRVLGRRRYQRS
jgi:hypothetical protein